MSTLLLENTFAGYSEPLEIKTATAWYNLGVVLINSGQFEAAIANFDKVLEIEPNLGEIWLNRGIAVAKLERHEEAIASYDEALRIQPDFYQAWNNRGIALDELGRNHEAIANYNKALELQPNYYIAWYNQGNVMRKLERLYEAITSYDKALNIQPYYHEAWYNRGNALFYLGRLDEAIINYDKALAIKPDKYEAWYNRGNALFDLRRLDEAILSYDKALEIQPDLYQAWQNRGDVLLNLLRLEEAIANYNKALQIKPDSPESFYGKASCYSWQDNVEQAIENLQYAINLSSEKYKDMAKTHVVFAPIRDDERFQALIDNESGWNEGEIDLKKDIIVQKANLSPEPGQINLKQLGGANLKEGEPQILHNVSWEEFETILSEMGDNRSYRVAYDQGTLEIRMPSQKHEYYKEIIRDLIKYLAEELDLDCEAIGSTTWKRKDLLKGAEPDNCFYIQNEPAIRSVKPNIDLSKDPPPDLILEIDYKSPSLDKQPIYAALGVPEIWRYDMEVLHIYHLESGTYKETDTSLAFGTFPVKQIPSFIEQNISARSRVFQKIFRNWVKQYIEQQLTTNKE